MPAVNITTNGATPVIMANAQRTVLMVQNNGPHDARYRFFGQVAANDPAKAGLLLKANGGSVILTGAGASRALFAITLAQTGQAQLDYESDA
jgi:hypothetical protein